MSKVTYLSITGTQARTFKRGPTYFDASCEVLSDGSYELIIRRHRGLKKLRTWLAWHLWKRWRRTRIRISAGNAL